MMASRKSLPVGGSFRPARVLHSFTTPCTQRIATLSWTTFCYKRIGMRCWEISSLRPKWTTNKSGCQKPSVEPCLTKVLKFWSTSSASRTKRTSGHLEFCFPFHFKSKNSMIAEIKDYPLYLRSRYT